MPDVKDTRGRARLTAVGERAASIDLESEEVSRFITLLKERHITIDPTLTIFKMEFTSQPAHFPEGWEKIGATFPVQDRRGLLNSSMAPKGMEDLYKKSYLAMQKFATKLYKNGIPIVAGTDNTGGFSLHKELEEYAVVGIPNWKILQIATYDAARTMHRENILGSISPHKLADLVLLDGNPVKNISDIEKINLVIKDGVLYKPSDILDSVGIVKTP
jgi:imidazolonepropionase-like amidohydrolase